MIVSDAPLEELASILSVTDAHMSGTQRDAYLRRADDRLPAWDESPDLWLPVKRLEPLGREIEARHGPAALPAFAAALIAHLGLRLAPRLATIGLPESVLEQYPAAYGRLVKHLRHADLTSYWSRDDSFLKDVRVTGGYSVPCGAEDVDLYSAMRRRSGLKMTLTQRDTRHGWTVIRRGGPPWFRPHLDGRHTDEFQEPGWERCYRRIADLLVWRPNVKGAVGTSWFYDPVLADISPRLAYLHRTPLGHGAFLIRHGPGPIHTAQATATSPTRRALVARGAYVPTCYSMVWPREGLIAWARPGDPRR